MRIYSLAVLCCVVFGVGAFLPKPPKCPDCSVVLCQKPDCKGGPTILDPKCGCCPICANQPAKKVGEKCGGLGNFGKCEPGLRCKAINKDYGRCECSVVACRCPLGTIFFTNDQGCKRCSCQNVAGCGKVDCTHCKHGTTFYTDKKGCRRCRCKSVCPKPSICTRIRCGYGLIRFTDANGCESCACITHPGGNTGGECSPSGLTGVIDECGTCRCEKNHWLCQRPKTCPKKHCVYKGRKYPNGAKIYQQCNKCTCSNGNWGCTKIGCRTGVCYLNGRAIPNRKRFFDGCNTCTCHVSKGQRYGSLACTRRHCGKCPRIYCPKKCPNGFIRNSNGCAKTCKCKPSKPKYCIWQRKKYPNGARIYQYCNRCWCGNGNWACTRKGCGRGVCYLNGRAIPNRKRFFDGCNTCTCHVSKGRRFGSLACTRRHCGKCPRIYCPKKCPNGFIRNSNGCAKTCKCKPSKPKPCKIGAVRYDKCNRCRCGYNRQWRCTRKRCKPGFCYFQGRRLKNGTRFFDGCNNCRCIVRKGQKYGGLACTRKFCRNCRRIFCKKLNCKHGYVKDHKGCARCRCKRHH